MVIAALPAYLITFYLLPQVDGFVMLVLVLFPFLLFGVGIGTSFRRPGEVGAAMILLGSGLDPQNTMDYDVVAFFNGVLATILGVGTMCLAHRLLFPSQASRSKVAAPKRLTQRTVRTIEQGKMTAVTYLGSIVTILNDLLLLCDQSEEPEQKRVGWAVDLCALGYEIVTLQQVCDHLPMRLAQYERRLVSEITGFVREPSDAGLLAVKGVSEKAYDSCLQALGNADPDSPLADHIASSLASLAVIRHRFNRQQPGAPLSVGTAPLSTREMNYAY
jgi:uncharacterized membrane protein YccC